MLLRRRRFIYKRMRLYMREYGTRVWNPELALDQDPDLLCIKYGSGFIKILINVILGSLRQYNGPLCNGWHSTSYSKIHTLNPYIIEPARSSQDAGRRSQLAGRRSQLAVRNGPSISRSSLYTSCSWHVHFSQKFKDHQLFVWSFTSYFKFVLVI